MTIKELESLGFEKADENEYTNRELTIFILSDDKISIIGEDENNFLSIPSMICKGKKELLSFFKLIEYDIQSKD